MRVEESVLTSNRNGKNIICLILRFESKEVSLRFRYAPLKRTARTSAQSAKLYKYYVPEAVA